MLRNSEQVSGFTVYVNFRNDATITIYQQLEASYFQSFNSIWKTDGKMLTGTYNDSVPWGSDYEYEMSSAHHIQKSSHIKPTSLKSNPATRCTSAVHRRGFYLKFFNGASVLVVLVRPDVNCAVKDSVLSHNVLQNIAGQHLGIVSGVDEGRTGGKRIIT